MILQEFPTLFLGVEGCSTEINNINSAKAWYEYVMNMDPDKRFITVIRALRNQSKYLGEQWKLLQDDFNGNDFFGTGE